MPVEFVTPPDYFVVENKLILYFNQSKQISLPLMYVYNIEWNSWYIVSIKSQQQHVRELHMTTPIMKFNAASCYIGEYYSLYMICMCK